MISGSIFSIVNIVAKCPETSRTVPERPEQSRNSLSCPLSRTEGALSRKK